MMKINAALNVMFVMMYEDAFHISCLFLLFLNGALAFFRTFTRICVWTIEIFFTGQFLIFAWAF